MAPQTLHVLLCVECKTFQVHIVKKANKWNCKICSTKQTLQRAYGTGSGAECRVFVQQLNKARGEIELAANTAIVEKINEDFAAEEAQEYNLQEGVQERDLGQEEPAEDTVSEPDSEPPRTKKSKWAVFLEEKSDSCNNNLY